MKISTDYVQPLSQKPLDVTQTLTFYYFGKTRTRDTNGFYRIKRTPNHVLISVYARLITFTNET